MKNKFEKVDNGIALAFMEISKDLPLKTSLQLDNLRELIIKDCNTLHQQALKEEKERKLTLPTESEMANESYKQNTLEKVGAFQEGAQFIIDYINND